MRRITHDLGNLDGLSQEFSDPETQQTIADNTDMASLEELGNLFPGISMEPWLPTTTVNNQGCSVYGYAQLNVRAHWDELKKTEPYKSLVAGKPVAKGQAAIWTDLIDRMMKCVKKKIKARNAPGAVNPVPIVGPTGAPVPGHERGKPWGPRKPPYPSNDWPTGAGSKGLNNLEVLDMVLCCKCKIMTDLCAGLPLPRRKNCAQILEQIKTKMQVGSHPDFLAQLPKCAYEPGPHPRPSHGQPRFTCVFIDGVAIGSNVSWVWIEFDISRATGNPGHELRPDVQRGYGPAWPPECKCKASPPPAETIPLTIHIARLAHRTGVGEPFRGTTGAHIVAGVGTCQSDGSWKIEMTESAVQGGDGSMGPTWTGVISRNGVITSVNETDWQHYLGRVVVGVSCIPRSPI